MIDFLYTNGDSFTNGNGIESDPAFSHLPLSERVLKWRQHSWPNYLSNYLKCNLLNEGEGAGSNARMVRTTINFLNSYPKNKFSNLLVVLGWTSVDRTEIYVEENNVKEWLRFNMGQKISSHGIPFSKTLTNNLDKLQKDYVTLVYNEYYSYTIFLQQVYMMKNLLDNLKIKYIFFNSLPWLGQNFIDLADENLKNIQQNLIHPALLNFKDTTNDNCMINYLYKNNLPISSCKHPMVEGHLSWAYFLRQEIKMVYKI